jgi:hypothetical protein
MANEIDINKRYRTRDGREVRIYATDGSSIWAVHGAILTEDGWWSMCWAKDGKFICGGVYDGSPSSSSDLIEVKSRIKRRFWVNLYNGSNRSGLFDAKADANLADKQTSLGVRIACVKVEIDVEEGEGL